MDEIKRIRGYLEQNQKIIHFASESVSLDGSFEESVIRKYNQDQETVQDYSLDIDGFRSAFASFQKESEESVIEIRDNGIKLSVKKKDVVGELNTELKIDGNSINCTTKQFLVDTKNLKITEKDLTFRGTVNGLSCNIGKFGIQEHVMTGGENSTIVSGRIDCNTLNLKNAVASQINCNPEGVSGKKVTMRSSKSLDRDEKEDTNTVVSGLYVKGNIWATNGWNDNSHGTMYNFDYDILSCKSVALMTESGSYTTKNRLRCNLLYSSNEGEEWSDERRKRNIKTLDPEKAADFFKRLRPKRYTVKKTGMENVGYIAQEVKEALEATGLEGIVEEERGYYAIRYPELIAFRIAMVQRNQKMIEEWKK